MDLVAIMTKLFTSTKGNDALRTKMTINKICLVCRWHKSHAMGCPRRMEHTRGTDTTSTTAPLTASIEEVKEEEGMDFLSVRPTTRFLPGDLVYIEGMNIKTIIKTI